MLLSSKTVTAKSPRIMAFERKMGPKSLVARKVSAIVHFIHGYLHPFHNSGKSRVSQTRRQADQELKELEKEIRELELKLQNIEQEQLRLKYEIIRKKELAPTKESTPVLHKCESKLFRSG